jgi:hypothetical protein
MLRILYRAHDISRIPLKCSPTKNDEQLGFADAMAIGSAIIAKELLDLPEMDNWVNREQDGQIICREIYRKYIIRAGASIDAGVRYCMDLVKRSVARQWHAYTLSSSSINQFEWTNLRQANGDRLEVAPSRRNGVYSEQLRH